MLDAAAAHPVSSAQTAIDLRVEVRGLPRLSAPLRLRLEGPYVGGGGARVPSFDWRLTANALGFPVGGRVVSTGTNADLSIYRDNYEGGTAARGPGHERVAQTAAASGRPLGLHPRAWFGRAHIDGEANQGGVDCE